MAFPPDGRLQTMQRSSDRGSHTGLRISCSCSRSSDTPHPSFWSWNLRICSHAVFYARAGVFCIRRYSAPAFSSSNSLV